MQDFVAITIVLAAAAYLARQAWLHLAKTHSGTCGSCGNCSSNDTLKSRQLVNLSTDLSHAKAQRR
jgi:hypothetical protein